MEESGVRANKAGGRLLVAALLAAVFVATSAVAQALQPEAAAGVSASLSSAQGDLIAQGEVIFDNTCASCHQSSGVGIEGTYPPLLGNPQASDPAFVEDVIRNGKTGRIEVAGVVYDSTMSPKSEGLSDDEIAAAVAYVVSLSTQSPGTGPVNVTALPVGVPERGRRLFRGEVGFANGASACASCHVAGSVGNLGGSSLGPDLTDVASRLGGKEGLSGWLAKPPAAVMNPIFSRHPLTTAEIADLAAFLDAAPSQSRPSYTGDILVWGGAAGALVLFVVMAIAWRGMRQTYVEKLRSRR